MHPTMLPAGGRQHRWLHYTTSFNTQSSAPEDGQNNCPKHVELTGIINKPLLLHLVGCLYYLYQWCKFKQISDNEIYLLIKYIKSVLSRVAKPLYYIQDARCLKVKSPRICWTAGVRNGVIKLPFERKSQLQRKGSSVVILHESFPTMTGLNILAYLFVQTPPRPHLTRT